MPIIRDGAFTIAAADSMSSRQSVNVIPLKCIHGIRRVRIDGNLTVPTSDGQLLQRVARGHCTNSRSIHGLRYLHIHLLSQSCVWSFFSVISETSDSWAEVNLEPAATDRKLIRERRLTPKRPHWLACDCHEFTFDWPAKQRSGSQFGACSYSRGTSLVCKAVDYSVLMLRLTI